MRIQSIDIFRGLTIFLMVFVNELAGISDIPAWMKHIPPDVDGMTIVDVVFPAFLFIVGMAIPLAVGKRLDQGGSRWHFWLHVCTRILALLILGVYMVNSAEMSIADTKIPKRWWSAILYISAILIWNKYPSTENGSKRRLFVGLRISGVIGLVFLFLVFGKMDGDEVIGMTPSWWGILGLIGWAYGLAIGLFMLVQRNMRYLVIVFGLLIVLILYLRGDYSSDVSIVECLAGQTGHLVHTLIVLSGMLCLSLFYHQDATPNHRRKIMSTLGLGIVLGIVGYLVEPWGGISKIAATPAWALYSSALCCFAFAVIFWVVDVLKKPKWATFVQPAGKNPLLTYILPPLVYALVGYSIYPDMLSSGIPGILRALVFSLFVLALAQGMTRKGIRMQL